MVNKSGDIGTRTETAIVKYVRKNGFDGADEMTRAQRLRLSGSHDQGDIGLCPGVMLSSKGGHMAENASDAKIATWLEEMEAQRVTRGADVAALITKRRGKGAANAGQWFAWMPGWTFCVLAYMGMDDDALFHSALPAVRITLAELCTLLRRAGYGTELQWPTS
jgi:hypothetical protein